MIKNYLLLYLTICSSLFLTKNNNLNKDPITILFYNAENLFDYLDDQGSGDDEFTSKGIRHWTRFKYSRKINSISRAILASNNWNIPELIGLCEVENKKVISDLMNHTLLRKGNLGYLHRESKDRRGIDVCLIYNKEKCHLIDSAFFSLELDKKSFSRDLLYAFMRIKGKYFHVFVCHWPSRYTGVLSTEKNRIKAAKLLIRELNHIYLPDQNANVIIMGDFNDESTDKSIQLLKNENFRFGKLKLLKFSPVCKNGTLKYRNQWCDFDHFLISEPFGQHISIFDAQICRPSFLITEDEKYLGKKPFRTFIGYKYIGGYSDHLPILFRILIKQ